MLLSKDKFIYYKSYLDKAIYKIDKYNEKKELNEIEEQKLLKLIYNAEYYLLICTIYYNIIDIK